MHHISDHNNATMHLSRIERSIYLDLIHLYYETERPLSLDIESLARRIRASEDLTSVELCLNEFFTKAEQGYFHARCALEISDYHDLTSAKSKAGKASAEAKKRKKAKLLADANKKKIKELNKGLDDIQQPLIFIETEHQQTPTNLEPRTYNPEPKDNNNNINNNLTICPENLVIPEHIINESIQYWEDCQRWDILFETELKKFIAHNRKYENKMADWVACFQGWVLLAPDKTKFMKT